MAGTYKGPIGGVGMGGVGYSMKEAAAAAELLKLGTRAVVIGQQEAQAMAEYQALEEIKIALDAAPIEDPLEKYGTTTLARLGYLLRRGLTWDEALKVHDTAQEYSEKGVYTYGQVVAAILRVMSRTSTQAQLSSAMALLSEFRHGPGAARPQWLTVNTGPNRAERRKAQREEARRNRRRK